VGSGTFIRLTCRRMSVTESRVLSSAMAAKERLGGHTISGAGVTCGSVVGLAGAGGAVVRAEWGSTSVYRAPSNITDSDHMRERRCQLAVPGWWQAMMLGGGRGRSFTCDASFCRYTSEKVASSFVAGELGGRDATDIDFSSFPSFGSLNAWTRC
jgi:hypothetical protein